jgi:hypothetical protein
MDMMDVIVKELEKVVTIEWESGCSVGLRFFDVKHCEGVHLAKRR